MGSFYETESYIWASLELRIPCTFYNYILSTILAWTLSNLQYVQGMCVETFASKPF